MKMVKGYSDYISIVYYRILLKEGGEYVEIQFSNCCTFYSSYSCNEPFSISVSLIVAGWDRRGCNWSTFFFFHGGLRGFGTISEDSSPYSSSVCRLWSCRAFLRWSRSRSSSLHVLYSCTFLSAYFARNSRHIITCRSNNITLCTSWMSSGSSPNAIVIRRFDFSRPNRRIFACISSSWEDILTLTYWKFAKQ